MKGRIIGSFLWLFTALCLYFFENNTGTRIVLCLTVMLFVIPWIRRGFFAPRETEKNDKKTDEKTDAEADLFRTETYPDAAPGEVRDYLPGDSVHRIHWKLTAKRMKLTVREDGTEPQDEKRRTVRREEENGKGRRKRRLILFLLVLFVLLLSLFLLSPVRLSAGALLNTVFEESEGANAYVYERLPAGESAQAALWILSGMLAVLTALTVLTGSRWMGLGMMAAGAALQVYFGLSLPGPVNVGIFLLFALWALRDVPRRGDGRRLFFSAAAALTAVVCICLFIPGVDGATEAASEKVRDALEPVWTASAGGEDENAEGVSETRHTHPLAQEEGEGEAQVFRAYRPVTSAQMQISAPEWIDVLRIFLMLLLTCAAVIAPFLPFMIWNVRRNRALSARKVFESEDTAEAVCAIFSQVIAWLDALGFGEGNLPYRDWTEGVAGSVSREYAVRFGRCAGSFEEAAYSGHGPEEEKRQEALALLKETEETLLSRATFRQKLRLRYGLCLWL